MFLYPYKIFALSKRKRLVDINNPTRTVGIYDVIRKSYTSAIELAKKINDSDMAISVILGEIISGIKLICLDLDDCFDENTGELEQQTKDFLKEFNENEYEISSSGSGIHIYILTTLDLDTFIVKDIEGVKSFECYTKDRHIVTTYFDFENTNLRVGEHDTFLLELYNRIKLLREQKAKESLMTQNVKQIYDGKVVKNEQDFNAGIYQRTPITDMYTLRGIGYKDPQLISIIDENPDCVDQSAHDAKLIRKLMYYTLSFDSAREMAKKTNYYKAKDRRHKLKFDDEKYIERTRQFILRGKI